MELKYLAGLAIVIAALFALFLFVSWSNAQVVQETPNSEPTLNFLSATSAFLAGILVMALVLFLILISLDKNF